MKIIELCPFSAGICGVWTRVLSESKEFVRLGHEVTIFSSDFEKGTFNRVPHNEKIGKIQIKRFKGKKYLISDNVISWFYNKNSSTKKNALEELKKLNPDVIITHLLHPHSANLCRLIHLLKKQNPKIKILLVTHAPFNIQRKFPLNLATKLWNWRNKFRFNNFDKIISITQWEKPYLLRLGIPEDKISYIPNGIPEEFFKHKKIGITSKDVLFLGRISPVKDIETLIKTAEKLPEVNFSLVGPVEKNYLKKINPLILKLKNIKLNPPIYDLNKKISLIDNHKIFVLPSKREAMPQALIEAMSRGKIVISSKTNGGEEIIKDKENGFLFDIGDSEKLAELIKENIKGDKKIQEQAIKNSEKYSWKSLINKYRDLFK